MSAKKNATKIKARILTQVYIEGQPIRANAVVEGTKQQIAALVDQGAADTNGAAVAYALNANGNVVTQLPSVVEEAYDDNEAEKAEAAKQAALEKSTALANAEAAVQAAEAQVLAAPTPEEKAAAETALESAQAALQALK
ncbi:hypothetical protein [Methylobacillus flagellatus]|uniref:hypothetical protein n=1 Tax=Methylobacillus flagellatus TaxID=405 RepID=UPI0010F824A7|nr:hypothetical protein [Methylobacillus flagellatus]